VKGGKKTLRGRWGQPQPIAASLDAALLAEEKKKAKRIAGRGSRCKVEGGAMAGVGGKIAILWKRK